MPARTVLLATLLGSLLLAGRAAVAAPLQLAVNDWCPYSCSPDSPHPGILIELVGEIFKASEIPVSFVPMPLARALEATRSGQVDGLVGIIPPMAQGMVLPAEPVITTQFCFFTMPDSQWKFAGLGQQYSELTLGLAFGKSVDARVEPGFGNVSRVSGEAPTRRMVKMLQLKRLDVILEDRLSVEYTVARMRLPPLRNAGCTEKKGEYVAFSALLPGASRYARILSDGLVRWRASGRLDEIIAGYLAPPK